MNTTTQYSFATDLLPGERWWGGKVADGRFMPYGTATITRNLSTWKHEPGQLPEASNQSAPLLVSTKGRFVWSEQPLTFSFHEGTLTVASDAEIISEAATETSTGEGTLRAAYRAACGRFFPPFRQDPRD